MNTTPYPKLRLWLVHMAGKLVGVQFKVDTIPFGAMCRFRDSVNGIELLRGFNDLVGGSNAAE